MNRPASIAYYLHIHQIYDTLYFFTKTCSIETARLKSTLPVNRVVEIYNGLNWQDTDRNKMDMPCLSISRSQSRTAQTIMMMSDSIKVLVNVLMYINNNFNEFY